MADAQHFLTFSLERVNGKERQWEQPVLFSMIMAYNNKYNYFGQYYIPNIPKIKPSVENIFLFY